ncbi:MAG: cytochrome c [Myxococcota bacterium]
MTRRLGRMIVGMVLLGGGCQAGADGDADGGGDADDSASGGTYGEGDPGDPGDDGGADDAGDDGDDSDGEPDGPPDGEGIEGILECPTVELPPYTRGVDATLTPPFSLSCGSCHGPTGSGFGNYPEIPGELTLDEFKDVVRQGRGLMPAFTEEFITEAQLEEDYAALSVLAEGADDDLLPAAGEWSWSEAQVQQAYERGLEAWRKPDHDGIACTNCHSPDAVDLAVIGFTDDDILRRSGLHLPAEDAAALVDFVHAQRRRFGIGRPCSKDWRPLQPGGEVLPGDTPHEQDASFAQELVERDYILATGRVETLADAEAVLSEMNSIDLRRLPIGIPFPRWTEDGFNGPEHSTINDYMMGVGRVPNDPDAWYALESAYIEDPSSANFYELLHEVTDQSNDMGFSEATADENSQANGRCNKMSQNGYGFLTFTDEAKRRSGLIVQHMMRMALTGQSGWYDLPPAPFVDYAQTYGEGVNPFFRLGAQLAEHNCRQAGPMLATWPEEPAAEIPASDLANGEAVELSRQLNHSWQSLGMVFDQTLLMQEDFTGGQNLHYWAIVGFDQDNVHLPFLYLHRILLQEHYYRDLRGTEAHPPLGMNHFGSIEVHPLLDGKRLFFKSNNHNVVDSEEFRAKISNTIRCNSYRTLLLLQRELLLAGQSGNHMFVNENNTQTLMENYSDWGTWVNQLRNKGGEALLSDAFAGHGDLCMDGLDDLIVELEELVLAGDDLAQ